MLKALIVDDEKHARESLVEIIKQLFDNVRLLGQASGVEEAFGQVELLQPNVVFLDIKMGDGSGFDLLKRYGKVPFKVVFTTAYDEFALEAFKFSAFDYLLKPVDTNELRETIDRLEKSINQEEDLNAKINAFLANQNTGDISRKKIVLKTSDSIHLVQLNKIIRCEADGNYSWIYIKDKPRILISKSLKHFDELFAEAGFFRVHQSHLVNLNFVNRIDKVDGGVLVLSDSTTLPIAVRKREQLFHLLDNF